MTSTSSIEPLPDGLRRLLSRLLLVQGLLAGPRDGNHPGDLWGIAERAYGNGARYQEIFEANREVIENPDLIYPGQKIRIPR